MTADTAPLTPIEWQVLNALADDIGPIEAICESLRDAAFDISVDEFLAIAFGLFCRGSIAIVQQTHSGLRAGVSRTIHPPTHPHEVVGDLEAAFRASCERGDYLRHHPTPPDPTPAGVPFGIYFDLTPSGSSRIE